MKAEDWTKFDEVKSYELPVDISTTLLESIPEIIIRDDQGKHLGVQRMYSASEILRVGRKQLEHDTSGILLMTSGWDELLALGNEENNSEEFDGIEKLSEEWNQVQGSLHNVADWMGKRELTITHMFGHPDTIRRIPYLQSQFEELFPGNLVLSPRLNKDYMWLVKSYHEGMPLFYRRTSIPLSKRKHLKDKYAYEYKVVTTLVCDRPELHVRWKV